MIENYTYLIEHCKLIPMDEALQRMRTVDEKGKSPDAVPAGIDEEFLRLIAEQRPGGEYYQQSQGDKLLYMKRIDRLRYDVAEREQERLAKKMEDEIERIKRG